MDRGAPVEVFDKGRGPGGRTATRRHDGELTFDHGAQYFTVRDERFRRQVEDWIARGAAARWNARVVKVTREGLTESGPAARYVGTPGMNAMAGDLLRGAAAHYATTVDRIKRDGAHWRLRLGTGEASGGFTHVIVTAPPFQSAELIRRAAPELAGRVEGVTMLPCWTLMLVFEQALRAPFDAAYVDDEGPLAWIARQSSKPQRAGPERWVVHARHDWSEAHLEHGAAEVADRLTQAFGAAIGATRPLVTHQAAHRWRYAYASAPLGEPCLAEPGQGLIISGDWCLGPRIESAYLSGLAAAESI